ncbi:hypothetical protein JZ751_023382 [Albula glossodonta]|uniref:LEM-like domain-containing protein n=1 Tax=Albula glossodonta TaxID=121402 RepID=A0A8T2NH53_9TELE|nr:hypothetical protein JZ751_023382 [Albula glossodonta]
MPVFVEDPAQFSKQRLKSELVANNVALPAGESKKHVYLELYMKHVSTKRAPDFSSDEEDQVQDAGSPLSLHGRACPPQTWLENAAE